MPARRKPPVKTSPGAASIPQDSGTEAAKIKKVAKKRIAKKAKVDPKAQKEEKNTVQAKRPAAKERRPRARKAPKKAVPSQVEESGVKKKSSPRTRKPAEEAEDEAPVAKKTSRPRAPKRAKKAASPQVKSSKVKKVASGVRKGAKKAAKSTESDQPPKKRGRPKGSKNKVKAVVKSAEVDEAPNEAQMEIPAVNTNGQQAHVEAPVVGQQDRIDTAAVTIAAQHDLVESSDVDTNGQHAGMEVLVVDTNGQLARPDTPIVVPVGQQAHLISPDVVTNGQQDHMEAPVVVTNGQQAHVGNPVVDAIGQQDRMDTSDVLTVGQQVPMETLAVDANEQQGGMEAPFADTVAKHLPIKSGEEGNESPARAEDDDEYADLPALVPRDWEEPTEQVEEPKKDPKEDFCEIIFSGKPEVPAKRWLRGLTEVGQKTLEYLQMDYGKGEMPMATTFEEACDCIDVITKMELIRRDGHMVSDAVTTNGVFHQLRVPACPIFLYKFFRAMVIDLREFLRDRDERIARIAEELKTCPKPGARVLRVKEELTAEDTTTFTTKGAIAMAKYVDSAEAKHIGKATTEREAFECCAIILKAEWNRTNRTSADFFDSFKPHPVSTWLALCKELEVMVAEYERHRRRQHMQFKDVLSFLQAEKAKALAAEAAAENGAEQVGEVTSATASQEAERKWYYGITTPLSPFWAHSSGNINTDANFKKYLEHLSLNPKRHPFDEDSDDDII